LSYLPEPLSGRLTTVILVGGIQLVKRPSPPENLRDFCFGPGVLLVL